MVWKPVDQMSRNELEAELKDLRARLEAHKAVEQARDRTQKKVTRSLGVSGDDALSAVASGNLKEEVSDRLDTLVEEWEAVETPEEFTRDAREHLDREMLHRFLTDLARLSASRGIVLDTMQGDGMVRLAPLTDWFGGYAAERVDEGPRVMASYGHGMAWDDPTDDVVGDDVHPDARQEQAREWQKEKSEALADNRFREKFLQARGAVDPDTDLEI